MAKNLWMSIDVLPRPILDVTGEKVPVCDIDGNVEDASMDKASDHSVRYVKFQRPCIFFKVSPEDLLFFFGEVVEPGYAFTRRKVLSIFSPRPDENAGELNTSNNTPGKQKTYTEIRLVLYPKNDQPDWFEKFVGEEYYGCESNSYGEKILRWIFEHVEKFTKPIWHKKPNGELRGGALLRRPA